MVSRLPYIACLAFAASLLAQALTLDNWGIFGPGPGLFPQVVTGFSVIVAAFLVIKPTLAQAPAAGRKEPEAPPADAERRSFRLYAASFFVVAAGSAWLGFLLTSVVLALMVTAWAEGVRWRRALAFGLACGIVGVVVFGRVMEITIPETGIERAIVRQLR